ncbi:MAG: single-stranded DNA-binding protein [Candidatus Obscuribacterales bacterium]|nr:single-stranded DNA-binding protein [Candidatus Obscuribacterales bacterium]
MNNSITLVGRVVADPIKKSFQAKDTVLAEFSLAVKDYSKKGQDDDAIYFDVKAFNGQVDRIMEYVTKGREIVITGRVSVESYNSKDGTKAVVKYVVILNGFHLCGGKLDKAEVTPEGASADIKEKKAKKNAA